MYIGVDVGGMSIKAGLVNDSGKILYKESVTTGARRPMPEILHDIGILVDRTIKNSGVPRGDIKIVGMGFPGACDSPNGLVIHCDNINLENAPIATEIHKYIDVPVFLDNDANVAALAEYYNLNKKMDCFITVTLGTGVGSGIIMNGRIFSGLNGFGAEIGHMVIKEGGEKCSCGRNGCWESYASVTALIRQTKTAMENNKNSLISSISSYNNVNGKTAFDAAKKGDNTAQEVVDNYIHHIATGVSNLIKIFQPEAIAIGGAISKEGDYLLNPLKKYCANEAYSSPFAKKTEIKIASLGNDAGIIGAAMLGRSNGVS